MTTIRWKRFFVESGLPTDIADNYAVIFVENRIRFDMLEELSREILNDMGIKKMGDVISILRHSKAVYSNTYREKLFANDECEEQQEEKESSKVKADSTISNDTAAKRHHQSSSEQQQQQQHTTDSSNRRRVVLPTKRQTTPIREQKPIQEETRVRQQSRSIITNPQVSPTQATATRPDKVYSETKIIRNVTGLNLPSAFSVNRKRVEPPGEEDVPKPKTIKVVDQPTPSSLSLSSSPLTTSQPVLNRTVAQSRTVSEQSRVSNFSRHIQRAISSNQPNPQPTIIAKPTIVAKPAAAAAGGGGALLSRPSTKQNLSSSSVGSTQKQPVRSRLSLNQSSTVVKTPDSTSTLPVKSRLGLGVKDRLGIKPNLHNSTNKSVFSRTVLDDNNSVHGTSVFSRLGAK